MMSGSDILFTTIHVITDWPISNHMNRDLTQRSCTAILWTQRAPIEVFLILGWPYTIQFSVQFLPNFL
ncbi:unnamed protein product [Staurois parvus]|uniref:Uncharacterized protein n=1 Tax=Staurois parvus TaxID=386267 RepID=A0ABN9C523_9NEOB|nr:unnamed protein product [Staurois parvus]